MTTHEKPETAVVLLSGGLDSATCLAIATDEYDTALPIHVSYGQQTGDIERERAGKLASEFNTKSLRVIDYQAVFGHFAGGVASGRDSFTTDSGSLTGGDGRSTGYVPMRNLHLLATASGIADVANADAVFIGVQGGDEDAYPDCREPFIEATRRAVNNALADGSSLSIRTPLLSLSKTDVIELAHDLGVPFEYTYSCYSKTTLENPEPCGECPACEERIEAFENAGLDDPVMVHE